jgi:hypothetical protein
MTVAGVWPASLSITILGRATSILSAGGAQSFNTTGFEASANGGKRCRPDLGLGFQVSCRLNEGEGVRKRGIDIQDDSGAASSTREGGSRRWRSTRRCLAC